MTVSVNSADVRDGETVVVVKRVGEDRWRVLEPKGDLDLRVDGYDEALDTAKRAAVLLERARVARAEAMAEIAELTAPEPEPEKPKPEKPKGPVRKGL